MIVSVLIILSAISLGQEPQRESSQVRSDVAGSLLTSRDTAPSPAEVVALRLETAKRLGQLEGAAETTARAGAGSIDPASSSRVSAGAEAAKSATAAGPVMAHATTLEPSLKKSVRELLQERLGLLQEYEKLSGALEKARDPDAGPERQAAAARLELKRLEDLASTSARDPGSLLPPSFRHTAGTLTQEMKDDLDAIANDLKEHKSQLEGLANEIQKRQGEQKSLRVERDKLFQRVASLKAKGGEFEKGMADAQSAGAQQLARERLLNLQWEALLESLRLRLVEAELAQDASLAQVRELSAQTLRLRIQLAENALKQMREGYRAAAETRERKLKQAAANEQNKARRAQDPLESLRARRTAERLAREVLVVKNEQALATNPSPSLSEERGLADRAAAEFAEIKALLDDGRVSRLDAIRLNNEFRRIGLERERLLHNELPTIEAQARYYEDALTSVELELLSDAQQDRFELELLREHLPPARRAAAEALVIDLDQKDRALLVRWRTALEKLTQRAGLTLQQVVRRLGILDEEYGFIRTHIFWVRDQDPIGFATLTASGREIKHLLNGLFRLAQETITARHWSHPSAEFVIICLGVLVLPTGLVRLRRGLRLLVQRDLHALRSLGLGAAVALVWPLYVLMVAYAARAAPWPRSLGILVSVVLWALAIALLVYDLLRWLVRPGGWTEKHLDIPAAVTRQLWRAGRFLAVGALCCLLPAYLLAHKLIAPEGHAVVAPALARLLILGFEMLAWGACLRLLRGRSALLAWISVPSPSEEVVSAPGAAAPASSGKPPDAPAWRFGPTTTPWRLQAIVRWLRVHRRLVAWLVLAGIASIIVLDIRGYSYSARRLAVGGSQSALVLAVAWAAYHVIARAIDQHAVRWVRPNRSWARALRSAVVLRASLRARGSTTPAEAPSLATDTSDPGDAEQLEDVAAGLHRLSAYGLVALGCLAMAWVWDLDLALARFILTQPIWSSSAPTPVTVGNLAEATVVMLLGLLGWRYMSTLFALTIFPRMPDDPGVRFAVVSLCRYAVLAVSVVIALGAVHLDLAKIGVVLAALGVGLGFGLQEIVSNFVCGIILLLERPIRIGDIVTVAGTTGKVDRINIRATTILNPDNQSMIVPNREFITGNLVNWTHKDKILRVPIKVNVAYGTDPDRVVELLLSTARQDVDVLLNPAPMSVLEGFGDSALSFGLYVFVPDPAAVAMVRHRLCTEIQRRFAREGIVIPLPTRALNVNRVPEDLTQALVAGRHEPPPGHRHDQPASARPAPHRLLASARPAPVDRVDELA
jgi:potassium efflux system protein